MIKYQPIRVQTHGFEDEALMAAIDASVDKVAD
jgi:hypothetical protein